MAILSELFGGFPGAWSGFYCLIYYS